MESFKFEDTKYSLKIFDYATSGNLAVCLKEGGNLSSLTVNLPGYYLDPDKAFIGSFYKDCGMEQALIDAGIIKEVVRKGVSYNMGKYDLVRFDMNKLKEYDPTGYKKYSSKFELDEDYNIKI